MLSASRLLLVSVAAVSLAQARGMSPRDVDALPSRPADVKASYGPSDLQFGELRLPEGKGPFPMAVVIHGGCWVRTLRRGASRALGGSAIAVA